MINSKKNNINKNDNVPVLSSFTHFLQFLVLLVFLNKILISYISVTILNMLWFSALSFVWGNTACTLMCSKLANGKTDLWELFSDIPDDKKYKPMVTRHIMRHYNNINFTSFANFCLKRKLKTRWKSCKTTYILEQRLKVFFILYWVKII